MYDYKFIQQAKFQKITLIYLNCLQTDILIIRSENLLIRGSQSSLKYNYVLVSNVLVNFLFIKFLHLYYSILVGIRLCCCKLFYIRIIT